MKRLGITGKLVFSSACIFTGLGLTVTWYSVSQLRSMLYQEMVRRVEAQALNWIEANTSQILTLRERATLDRLVEELRNKQQFAYVILWDAEGRLPLASSATPAGLENVGEAETVPGIKSRLHKMKDDGRRRYYQVETPISASGTGMNTDLDSMFRLTTGDKTGGVLRIGVKEQELNRRLRVLVTQNVALFGALVLLALAVNIVLAKRMVTPITSMARAANQIAAGYLSERVRDGLELRDEVGELVRNFNQMASRLEENREEMNLLYSGLEEKIRDRTAELEQANRELAQANTRLQELDRLKSHSVSTVAHELNTPLTSIKSFAEILLDSPNLDPAKRNRWLRIINSETDRLSRLIKNVLNLDKMDRQAMPWRMSDVDLAELVAQATEPLAGLADEKGIELMVDASDPMPVWADADTVQQVVTNLVDNAIKFCSKGGRIEIRLDRVSASGPRNALPGHYARVAVSDTGPGILQEELERVFDRNCQIAKSLAATRGAGLGLAIAREIVLHHKGEIWVESQPGVGSTFYFTVPLLQESATLEREAPGVQTEGLT